ncbi:MAG: GNAT family N-acetyltransferase [Chitinophagales bacterium]|nr:GNAT family N-acetyltransferase [Chitinophagales bacterium]
MTTEFFIRQATETDLPGILEIYNDAILNTTAVYDYKPHTLEMRAQWFREQQKNNFPVFVALLHDKVVGFASYGKFRMKQGYKYTVEHSVYIHPDFRNQGIGKKLLARIIEAARANNMHCLLGGVDANNTGSIKFHEHFHFKEAGHLHQVSYKFGKWLDLKFLELILDTPAKPSED